MNSQAQQAMEREELLKHRREGGLWLRAMREQAGLSQRELATAVGADYYSFVSQLESGKGRVPVAQVELWARALKVPRSVFARGLLRYYDPITYDMLFGEEEAGAAASGDAEPSRATATIMPAASPTPRDELALADQAGQRVASQPAPALLAPSSAETDQELRARVNRLEAILMLRGAKI